MISFESVDVFLLNLHGHFSETRLNADYIYMTWIPFSRSKKDLDIFTLNKLFFHNQWVESNKTFRQI